MKRLLGIMAIGLLTCTAYAGGSVLAGKEKSTVCAACHGPDGVSLAPNWPNLAGQHASYLVAQLHAFKKGDVVGGRYDSSMTPLMVSLTDEDMADLAAFYASLPLKIGAVDQRYLARGQQLYRGGDLDKRITACSACHGPSGRGINEAALPSLSGQKVEYVVKQLHGYRDGNRKNGRNDIMKMIAQRMSDDDITAVANYVYGLH